MENFAKQRQILEQIRFGELLKMLQVDIHKSDNAFDMSLSDSNGKTFSSTMSEEAFLSLIHQLVYCGLHKCGISAMLDVEDLNE